MNRQELLTKLAMELEEWPTGHMHVKPCGNGEWRGYNNLAFPDSDGISKEEYLAERKRLINKPSWAAAPEWAEGLAQDRDGDWKWLGKNVVLYVDGWTADKILFCTEGAIPAGHRWQDTLEKRPVDWPDERRIDVIGANGNDGAHYEDEAFRECERRLHDQHLSDELRCPSPGELVRRMLIERCDELKSANDLLVDDNQRLRRALNELTQEAV